MNIPDLVHKIRIRIKLFFANLSHFLCFLSVSFQVSNLTWLHEWWDCCRYVDWQDEQSKNVLSPHSSTRLDWDPGSSRKEQLE